MSNGKIAAIISGAYVGTGYSILLVMWYGGVNVNHIVTTIFYPPVIGGMLRDLTHIFFYEVTLFLALGLLTYSVLWMLRRQR